MKKLILTLAIILLLATDVYACEAYTAFLFTEGEDPTAETCEAYPAQFESIDIRLWICSDPGRGLAGFELGIDFDSDDTVGYTLNPGVGPIIGDITSEAFAGAFMVCQTDQWVWIVKYQVLYAGTPHRIYLVLNSETVQSIVTSCETDYPQYELSEGNRFGVNMACIVDSEEESWGAVKAMYR
ncbi:MAG: hypothetical protein R6U43_02375 [Candidatus Krumholzibacteriales bacterium]